MNLNFLYSALVVLFMLPPPLNAQHKGNKGHAPDNEGMENKSFNDHEWDEKFEKYFERWMENHGPDNHAQRRRARWPWWSVRGNITGDRAFIGTINANPLLFRTSDSLRLSISSSGDVEIFKNLTVNKNITGTSMQLSGLTGPGMVMVDEFGNIRMSNIGISKDTISINNLQTNNFYVKNNLQIGNTIYANVSSTSHDNFIYTDGTNLNIQRTPDGVTQTAGNLILCEKTADNDNNVGIKNNNPIYDLDVNGDINFSGSILKDGNELNMDGLWKPYSQVDAQGWMIEGTNNPFIGPAAKIIVEGGKNGAMQIGGDIHIMPGDLGNRYSGVIRLGEDIYIQNNQLGINTPNFAATNSDINLIVNGKSRFIDKVGIGKNPNVMLDVDGDINFTGDLLKNGENFNVWLENDDGIYFNEEDKNIGIGCEAPSFAKLEVMSDKINMFPQESFPGKLKHSILNIKANNEMYGPSPVMKLGIGMKENSEYFGYIQLEEDGGGLVLNPLNQNIGIGHNSDFDRYIPEYTLHLLEKNSRIAFGDNNPFSNPATNGGVNCFVGEYYDYRESNNPGDSDILQLHGKNGLVITTTNYADVNNPESSNGENILIYCYGANMYPQNKVCINGMLEANRIKVSTSSWPDYVFKNKENILSLNELESYIKMNNHLPGVPSEKQVKTEGVDIGEMQKILLEKIEEMSLYLIELKNENAELKKEINNLRK